MEKELAVIINELLRTLYQYAVVGGIIILLGLLLKSFLTVLATNIWMRIFSRSRIANSENLEIFSNGQWWRVRRIGFNRVKLFRKNLDENGEQDKDTPEIFMEMLLANYWKNTIIYK